MAIVKEFKEFALKGNVVDLAVAVVMGAAFGKIVSAVVGDLIMPFVNALMPKGDWRTWEATTLHFKVGDLLGTVVDFVVVALVIFIVVVKVMQVGRKPAAPEVAVAPATKSCPECLETVPTAARRCRACATVLASLALLLLLSRSASAQSAPEFTFAKPDEAKTEQAKPVEWKAQAKAGALLTGGNSQTQNVTLGASASRKAGDNRFSLEGGLAYGRSNNRQSIVDATNTITGIDRQSVVSTNTWFTKGRYDRFLTPNNILYASAQAGADKIAGKSFMGGGQLGYSRQLLKTDLNLVVAEVGYDFSHEEYVQQPGKTLDSVSIHSARVMVSEALKLTADTGLNASVEALFNLNKEQGALSVGSGQPGVDAFKDTRVIGKLGVTSTLYKNLSMNLGLTLKYDQNPAPLPIPAGSPAGASYQMGFQPFADTVDVLAEAALSYAFL